jgi:hypothetical protein
MVYTTIAVTPELDGDTYTQFEIEISDAETTIGTGNGILIDYDWKNRKSAIIDADGFSGDALEIIENFQPCCLQDPEACFRIAVVDKIEIDVNYRGNGYGLDAMRSIIKFFSMITGTVIVILPSPIGTPSKPNGEKRLQKYWMKCGFERCKNTKYFFKECDYI